MKLSFCSILVLMERAFFNSGQFDEQTTKQRIEWQKESKRREEKRKNKEEEA
jgi:hypothetical protein